METPATTHRPRAVIPGGKEEEPGQIAGSIQVGRYEDGPVALVLESLGNPSAMSLRRQ